MKTSMSGPSRTVREPITAWPEALRAEIESSWEAIFDLTTWRTPPVLQELRAEDVVGAVRIR